MDWARHIQKLVEEGYPQAKKVVLQASHGADAFRYLSQSISNARAKEDDEAEYKAHLAAFHEPEHHPLYGNVGAGWYR